MNKVLLIKKEDKPKIPENIMKYIEDEILNNPYCDIKIVRHGNMKTLTVHTNKKKQFSNVDI